MVSVARQNAGLGIQRARRGRGILCSVAQQNAGLGIQRARQEIGILFSVVWQNGDAFELLLCFLSSSSLSFCLSLFRLVDSEIQNEFFPALPFCSDSNLSLLFIVCFPQHCLFLILHLVIILEKKENYKQNTTTVILEAFLAFGFWLRPPVIMIKQGGNTTEQSRAIGQEQLCPKVDTTILKP